MPPVATITTLPLRSASPWIPLSFSTSSCSADTQWIGEKSTCFSRVQVRTVPSQTISTVPFAISAWRVWIVTGT